MDWSEEEKAERRHRATLGAVLLVCWVLGMAVYIASLP